MNANLAWPDKAVELGVLVRGVVQLDRAVRQPITQPATVDRDGLISVLAFCYAWRRRSMPVRR